MIRKEAHPFLGILPFSSLRASLLVIALFVCMKRKSASGLCFLFGVVLGLILKLVIGSRPSASTLCLPADSVCVIRKSASGLYSLFRRGFILLVFLYSLRFDIQKEKV